MDNKDYLEHTYKTNYDSAVKFVQYNNLPEAKKAFKRSLEAAIRLIEISYGSDRARYKTNAETVAQLLEKINAKLEAVGSPRPARSDDSPVKEQPKPKAPEPKIEKLTPEQAMAKLNALEGLHVVKSQVKNLVYQIKVFNERKLRKMSVPDMSYHMVFMGNPGTGKTTVARIMSQIYCALGILSKGQLVEVKRNDLVAGYVGQTAIKTQAVIDKAMGGVLFLDEAYTLNKGGNDFGQEAIDTILKAMEDNRGDFVVIVAGYDELMHKFIDSNPGLKSRFKNYINFTDYTGEEMYNIFTGLCRKNQFTLTSAAGEMLKNHFAVIYEKRDDNFGNARDVRNLFEETVARQANRLAPMFSGQRISDEAIATLIPEDLPFYGVNDNSNKN